MFLNMRIAVLHEKKTANRATINLTVHPLSLTAQIKLKQNESKYEIITISKKMN